MDSGVDFNISPPMPGDEAAWRCHWRLYLAVYDWVEIPVEIDERLWKRLLANEGATRGLIARDADGAAIGFCHFVLHESTWSEQRNFYIHDMFVEPAFRRRGVAQALVRSACALAKQWQCYQFFWHARAENLAARRLYDRLTGGPLSLCYYSLKI
jgi:GNAT superfamily N-acetyltransferase